MLYISVIASARLILMKLTISEIIVLYEGDLDPIGCLKIFQIKAVHKLLTPYCNEVIIAFHIPITHTKRAFQKLFF